MNQTHSRSIHHLLDGTARIFLSEAVLFPTGLVTAIYLTRKLGPDGYGVYVLAAAVVGWVEWNIGSFFFRPGIKWMGDAPDGRPVQAALVRGSLVSAVLCAVVVGLLARPMAVWFGEPRLAAIMLIFLLDIPFFSVAQAFRTILTGQGRYGQRALSALVRWVGKLVLIVVLVEAGLSLEGAVWGSIGASVLECLAGQWMTRVPWFLKSSFPVKRFLAYAGPLFLSMMALRLFEKMDLLVLKTLGASSDQVGLYGAAQNASTVFLVFGLSFSPLVLHSLNRARREADGDQVRFLGRQSLRVVMLTLPVACLLSGSAAQWIPWFFGKTYASSGPILSYLLFGTWGLLILSVGSAILMVFERSRAILAITLPVLPAALAGQILAVPLWGPLGAARVTACVGILDAIGMLWAVRHWCGISLSKRFFGHSLWISCLLFAGSMIIPSPGPWVMAKLIAGAVLAVLLFAAVGEWSREDKNLLKSLFLRRTLLHE